MGVKITCISDTHQHHAKVVMPRTDIIIHAGDFSYHGTEKEVRKFLTWYGQQPAKHRILVCGNHEVWIKKYPQLLRQICEDNGVRLLQNQHIEVEGVKIFGTPYSVEFGNWAYGLPDSELSQIWNMIDPDVEVLVSHGPAHNRLDWCPSGNVGSRTLTEWIDSVPWKLKLHVTGHIHESRGCAIHYTDTYSYLTVNAAICGIPYTDIIVNPITVEI